jgi:hypothetical protein
VAGVTGKLKTMHYPAIPPIVAVSLKVAAAPSDAEVPAPTWRFDVPRQGAAGGIAAFSRQAATVQLLVAQDAVRHRRTNRLSGVYSVENGLTTLLRGSGLRWLRTGPATYSLIVSKDQSR